MELQLKYEKLLENQHKELSTLMCAEKIRCYPSFQGTEFTQIKQKISVHALEIILKQIKKPKTLIQSGAPLGMCTFTIRNSLGLPCLHELAQLGVNAEIPLDYIHPFWTDNTDMPIPIPVASPQFYLLLDDLKAVYESSSVLHQQFSNLRKITNFA